MKSQKYLFYHEIIDVIKTEYKINQHTMAFSQAINQLVSSGKYHTEIPTFPDFSLWDIKDIPSFKLFTDQIPVFFDEIHRSNEPDFKSETIYTSEIPVFISQSALYSPAFFKRFDNYIMLFYVLSGHATLNFKSETCQLHKGNLLIIPQGKSWHLACSEEDIILQIMIRKDYFEDYFFNIINNQILLKQFYYQTLFSKSKDYISFILEPSAPVLNIIKNLFIEYLVKDTYSSEIFMNYLQIFFTYILRSTVHIHISDKDNTNLITKTIIPAILQYIYENYETLTLEKLANHFHYSTVYLSKLITDNMGENFKNIITRLKIKKAKELLITTNLSVTEISLLSGYNKSDYFAVAFKKETGTSPSNYRKMLPKH